MGLPNINITFEERGITAIKRGERGIVSLIIEDNAAPLSNDKIDVITPSDIPSMLTEENRIQVELALMGYVTPPKKVIVCIIKKSSEEVEADYKEIQNYLETIRFDYVAIPQIKDSKTDSFATWIKTLRDTKKKKVKAVLPNTAADHEGIINFTTDNIVTKFGNFNTTEYCGRIAGLIAGTPLTIACTFAPLPEVLDCDKLKADELSKAIKRGELVLYNDGEKIKIARGINSFVTTVEGKGKSYQKIKIVEALDLIFDDITKEAEDNYLGKYSNSYDNKCLLMVAIMIYLDALVDSGILNGGHQHIRLNLDKQIRYLKLKDYVMPDGRDVENMSELEIKKADTGDQVFLKGGLKVLDAMEEIDLPIAI